MPLRDFKMPDDLDTMIHLLMESFQYPENPEWGISQDQKTSLVDQFQMIKRLWPIMSVVGRLSPALRNAFRGFIWEEDGQPVGLVNTGIIGSSKNWFIGNVSVLPAYRRRGLARQLVQAAIQLAEANRASGSTLQVIRENVPAVKLYKELGFEIFDGSAEYRLAPTPPMPSQALPDEYVIDQLSSFDWRPRFELAKRLTPESITQFSPVTEAEFRITWFMQILGRLFAMWGPSKQTQLRVLHNGQMVALVSYNARRREGGINHLRLRVDPQHAAITAPLVSFLLHELNRIAPNRTTETEVVDWQPHVQQALQDAGFHMTSAFYEMGLHFAS